MVGRAGMLCGSVMFALAAPPSVDSTGDPFHLSIDVPCRIFPFTAEISSITPPDIVPPVSGINQLLYTPHVGIFPPFKRT
ncbi:hypothetical protein N657DRAFT_649375 [Parathielavia appendiculata]|uniref:Secreted protein n=1 Tax=Parathielavia appendiculata TaxID=2587402 RepID=A0AAN6YZX7_9PEZI|nr:hypothetical protein N657DRAFT_649375 [Parathielavia appendiculata]